MKKFMKTKDKRSVAKKFINSLKKKYITKPESHVISEGGKLEKIVNKNVNQNYKDGFYKMRDKTENFLCNVKMELQTTRALCYAEMHDFSTNEFFNSDTGAFHHLIDEVAKRLEKNIEEFENKEYKT